MATFLFFSALDFRDPIWQFWIGVGSLGFSAVPPEEAKTTKDG